MKTNRKLVAALAGAAIAPVIVLVGPVGTASAHGYVNAPASRQAQCAQNIVSCGDIKWEPQSVEGPKGQRTCNGGVARFAELNDNSKPWRATATGGTVTFNWTFTARHKTSTYEYYIGNTRIASFSGNNQVPPATVSHSVDLGNRTGRQTVLAIWNIADTANAFYSCVDLQVS
ncbi:lytic polysaccharide monooxygenase auxiliary activity family 9 protein [Amycolatopsis sp. DSM 110486]|uniref:lytic polysaccharide monooxygenase auxiliary activity family 9 protein n=1 Tax=Amycolatopsis sp. DSM 110486 TaxID=2865832 RepID=UPI001C6A6E2A|nr:lytic polysaccharide monooxygenase auxiliary activity family 9 protein [Amycolatopsis sp. DSM 110486]QYN22222.1 lytic polysaccharide monooxygenase [Amycolatopsis sp. DSM 110486]